MGQLQNVAGNVSDGENQEGLQNQRHGNEDNVQRILQNDTALKGEDQHQRQKQADGGDAIEFSDKGVFKIVLSVLPDDQGTGQHTAGQRNHHKEYY